MSDLVERLESCAPPKREMEGLGTKRVREAMLEAKDEIERLRADNAQLRWEAKDNAEACQLRSQERDAAQAREAAWRAAVDLFERAIHAHAMADGPKYQVSTQKMTRALEATRTLRDAREARRAAVNRQESKP